MYIFLGIAAEIATIAGTIAISANGVIDFILEIAKNGYKIDQKVIDEIKKNQNEEKKNNSSNLGKMLNCIVMLIPGVNLLKAAVISNKLKRSVMNNPQLREAMVPMTDLEKEQFAKLKTRKQKLMFTAFMSDELSQEKSFLGIYGENPVIVDSELELLYHEELESLGYTLDEVKKLNEATHYSYKIGKMDDRNVAIIGVPNPDKQFSRVKLRKEDYKINHSYETMTDEEAQNAKFAVYPFIVEEEEVLRKAVDEIKQSRDDASSGSNFQTLKMHSVPDCDSTVGEEDFIMDDEISTEEQSGHVYRKVPRRNIK